MLHTDPVPLFGNTFKLTIGLERQVTSFGRIYQRFSDAKICGFYQTRTPYLVICDPELINIIMIKDKEFSYFTDHGLGSDESTT